MNKPAHSYIKRNVELVSLQARIPEDVKKQAEEAAHRYGTSLNRFVEASLVWYMEQLAKEERKYEKPKS